MVFGSKRISRKVDLVVAFSPVLNLRNKSTFDRVGYGNVHVRSGDSFETTE